ncbi:cytochrome-c oxidase, cbb3-type subunit III [Pseudahrensia aquimaris]|uniref:Cbb3-type cytochrome c oxidase subunit n=1 Tax=Pseudahrensia aquimaris TaxID=744461 RepID=A0ABW3FJU0_9HYPH
MSDQEKDIDQPTGVETTGHEWDGIKELNNPLPRWWLWTFYATIIWSVGYMVYYPAIPLIEGSTMGISGVTARGNLKVEMDAADLARRDKVALLAEQDITEVAKNEELVRFATAGGSSLYKVNCSQCHGAAAQGGEGYPNLSDDDWLWGGDLEAIYITIAHGVRNDEDDDARQSAMPAYGKDELLSREEVNAVAEYVLQISGKEHDAALAGQGQATFAEQCSACHGENGKGIRDLGAPNLTDAIALYGSDRESLRAQIWNPQQGAMPPWIARLGDANIKQLAIYVHSLGGGEADKEE